MKSCGALELSVFVAALLTGCASSLSSKLIFTMTAPGLAGQMNTFSYPIMQSIAMFLGMTAVLPLHFLIVAYSIPFPGYVHSGERGRIPWRMYIYMAIPALFDVVATTVDKYGLMLLPVSVFQMLKGSVLVYTALVKQYLLGQSLRRFMWIGIAIDMVSIVVVGATALMSEAGHGHAAAESLVTVPSLGGSTALLGVLLVLAGCSVRSMQYVFEEKVMETIEETECTNEVAGHSHMQSEEKAVRDAPSTPKQSSHQQPPAAVSPLLLIGMEGVWGILICAGILYPTTYLMPGSDHGSFENPINACVMISNSSALQSVLTFYTISTLVFNTLALLVTFLLDSVWHAILDNFRPVTVWVVDLILFYTTAIGLGEPWDHHWSWLQLVGMLLLIYGTAIYNAPHPGSVLLKGSILSCFVDCTEEYAEMLNSLPIMDILAEEGALANITDNEIDLALIDDLLDGISPIAGGFESDLQRAADGRRHSIRLSLDSPLSPFRTNGRNRGRAQTWTGGGRHSQSNHMPVYTTMTPFIATSQGAGITPVECISLYRQLKSSSTNETPIWSPLFVADDNGDFELRRDDYGSLTNSDSKTNSPLHQKQQHHTTIS